MNSLDRMILETHAGRQFARAAFKRRHWLQVRLWLDYAKAHHAAALLIHACGVSVGAR